MSMSPKKPKNKYLNNGSKAYAPSSSIMDSPSSHSNHDTIVDKNAIELEDRCYNPNMTIPINCEEKDFYQDTKYQKSQAMLDLEKQVDDVVIVVKGNVEKILNRDDKLADLEIKSVALERDAQRFQKTTNYISHKYWWKNAKMKIIMVSFIIFVVCCVTLWLSSSNKSPEESYIIINPRFIA